LSRTNQTAAARARIVNAAGRPAGRPESKPEGRLTLDLGLRQGLEELDVVVAARDLLDDRFRGCG